MRYDVVCNACCGELRDWTQTGVTDEGAIKEGQCRDCDFYARIHVSDAGEVEILMGDDWR